MRSSNRNLPSPKGVLLPLLAVACLLLAQGCSKDEEKPNPFTDSAVVGKWCVDGTHEYWRYRPDHTGVTWDEDDDVHEEDATTMRFSWSLSGDQLRHTFAGDEVTQAVVEDHTLKSLSASEMVRYDGIRTYTLHKAE